MQTINLAIGLPAICTYCTIKTPRTSMVGWGQLSPPLALQKRHTQITWSFSADGITPLRSHTRTFKYLKFMASWPNPVNRARRIKVFFEIVTLQGRTSHLLTRMMALVGLRKMLVFCFQSPRLRSASIARRRQSALMTSLCARTASAHVRPSISPKIEFAVGY